MNENKVATIDTPEILAKQVAEWRKEVARLNDLIAHAEGRDSQAASIDTPEFRELAYAFKNSGLGFDFTETIRKLIAHIDAELVQEWLNGFSSCAEAADIIQEKTNCELVKMEARAIAAESRLAEIQRGVEGLMRWTPTNEGDMMPWDDGNFIDRDDALALLAPQGQADTSGLPG